MKHNEIVLSITKVKLNKLLGRFFGEKKGEWSQFHWVVDEEIKDWKIDVVKDLFQLYKNFETSPNLEELKKEFTKDKESINNIKVEESLEIEKTIEFPLIKGEGQYRTTKGFIDIIAHCKPITKGTFSTYQESEVKEFIIEIKKEEDFIDWANILRQIKEYREYYSWGCQKWESRFIKYGEGYCRQPNFKRIFCVLSTKIPQEVKEIFEEEKIFCLELEGE